MGLSLRTYRVGYLRIDLSRARLEQAMAAIEERLDEEISMRDLAATLGMEPESFARLFRESTGRSPSQYLAERRVAHARRWLEQTRVAIDMVAVRCGFKSRADLARRFAQFVGVSPGTYRHSHFRRPSGRS